MTNPKDPIRVVHPALASLQSVEHVKKGYAGVEIPNSQRGIVRQAMMDAATGEYTTTIAFGKDSLLLLHLQRGELRLCVGSARNVIQTKPELLGHNWLYTARAGYTCAA
jgi:hypothetical protein